MSSQMASRLRSFEAFANAPSVEIRRNSLHPSHGRLLFPHNIVANSNSAFQVVSLLANVPSDTMQRPTDEEAQTTHISDPHTPARWRSDGVARRLAGECVSTHIQSSMTPTESASSAAPGLGKVLSRCTLTSMAWCFPSGMPSDTRMTMLVSLAYLL